MVTQDSNREVSFVIEKRLGVLSQSQNGWRKELNLVSWNGKPAKLDIREWSPDHERMAKGITLRSDEARQLQRNLYRWFTGYGKPAAETAPAEVPPQEDFPEGLPAELPDEMPVDMPEPCELQTGMDFPADPETGEILDPKEMSGEECSGEVPEEPEKPEVPQPPQTPEAPEDAAEEDFQ